MGPVNFKKHGISTRYSFLFTFWYVIVIYSSKFVGYFLNIHHQEVVLFMFILMTKTKGYWWAKML